MNQVHFSSQKSDWETPKDFFNRLDKEFNFNIDVCANSRNKKCEFYYSPEQNGLKKEWGGRAG